MAEWKELLTEVITEEPESFEQIRLTVSELNDRQYLHLRKYYLGFDGDYLPTKTGISIPITIVNIANLFNALTKMLSESEVLQIILDHADEEVRNNVRTGSTSKESE